jgi:hypothetical protein
MITNYLVRVKGYPPEATGDNKESKYVEARQPENPYLLYIVLARNGNIRGKSHYGVVYIPNGRDVDIHYRKVFTDFPDG